MTIGIAPAATPPKVLAIGDAGFDRGLLLQILAGRITQLQQTISVSATQIGERSAKSIPGLSEAGAELYALNALQQQVLDPLNGKIRVHQDVRPALVALFAEVERTAPSAELTALRAAMLDPVPPIAKGTRARVGARR